MPPASPAPKEPEPARAGAPAAAEPAAGPQPAPAGDAERPVWGPAAQPAAGPARQPAEQRPAPEQQAPPPAAPQRPAPQQAPQAPAAQAPAPQQGAPAAPGQGEMIRRAWPETHEELSSIRRVTWMNVSANATPAGFDGAVLALGFKYQGSATNFERGDHAENLRRAIHKVLGVDCQIRTVDGSSAAAGESGPKAPTSRPEPARVPDRQPAAAPEARQAPAPEAPRAAAPVQAPPRAQAPAPAAAGAGAQAAAPAPGAAGVRQAEAPAAAGVRQAEASVPAAAVWAPAVSNTPQPVPAAWGPAVPEKPVFTHGTGPSAPAHVWGPAPETVTESAAPAAGPSAPAAAPSVPAAGPSAPAAVATAPAPAAPAPARAPQPPSPYEGIPYSDEEPTDEWETPPDPGRGRTVSRYQQLPSQAKAAEARQPAAPAVGDGPGRGLNLSYVEDIPSDDDESIEDSILVGRAAIERILGGRLIEERSLDAP
ncbi:hypothetical protein HER39_14925 [Arthrobacter deserti]|uniref:DNA polymerase III subunit gamma and tau n=1 Tax=Arthrobacter deserti TaxID=1742687 RepID=A0ABX1JR77_9MICC|nr:hypothetical protein [Arthrobacter deserti]